MFRSFDSVWHCITTSDYNLIKRLLAKNNKNILIRAEQNISKSYKIVEYGERKQLHYMEKNAAKEKPIT